nr:rho GTPase-activating protein 24-like [Pogona vitticeps]
MFEEDLVSQLFTRTESTEDLGETNKAITYALEFQDHLEPGQMNNCNECPLSSNSISTSPSSLEHHFASLKHQMAHQKAEYEAKISSLEQQNNELQLEIKNLHSKLGQQRKWFRLVEIKMRNAERAYEDAERRNEALQKEMEEFFNTFGELTNETKIPEQITQCF